MLSHLKAQLSYEHMKTRVKISVWVAIICSKIPECNCTSNYFTWQKVLWKYYVFILSITVHTYLINMYNSLPNGSFQIAIKVLLTKLMKSMFEKVFLTINECNLWFLPARCVYKCLFTWIENNHSVTFVSYNNIKPLQHIHRVQDIYKGIHSVSRK